MPWEARAVVGLCCGIVVSILLLAATGVTQEWFDTNDDGGKEVHTGTHPRS